MSTPPESFVAASAPTEPCVIPEDIGTDYGLRIGALFAIMTTSFLGGVLPLVSRSANLDKAFFFGTVFAGGVVLATGFVHILPDAVDAMSNPCLKLSTTYPWAYVFAGTAALLTFAIEYFLKQIIRSKLGLPIDSGSGFAHSHGAEVVEATPLDAEVAPDSQEKLVAAQMAENRVAAIMLEAGVIFHSIFIGIDIGLNSDPSVVRPLMIALMFHQIVMLLSRVRVDCSVGFWSKGRQLHVNGFEGLALGSTFIRAHFSTLKYMLYLVVFVLVTPIGIAIGLGVGSSYNADGHVALGFEGAFNSVSAGILVYNGLVDLLIPTFMSATMLAGNYCLQLLAMAFMFAGYACMSLLAKWA